MPADRKTDLDDGSFITIVPVVSIVQAVSVAGRKVPRERRMPWGIRYPLGRRFLVRLRFIHIMQRFKLYDCRYGKTLRY
jgi:hypothetical protein